ncbi:conserved hypothetical protein [Ricinus communis]|uniref:Uncharacterized protein n=1 Tax=Ricinus communis TaxID=3988 RepID=B9S559_RICCO|nr:conserved hypothetical protein [Ricinus communis]
MEGDADAGEPTCGCGNRAILPRLGVIVTPEEDSTGVLVQTSGQECNVFQWYDMEYTESQLIYVNGLRRLVNELMSERNEALIQAGEDNAINDAGLEEILAIKTELEVMKETSNAFKVENQMLKE